MDTSPSAPDPESGLPVRDLSRVEAAIGEVLDRYLDMERLHLRALAGRVSPVADQDSAAGMAVGALATIAFATGQFRRLRQVHDAGWKHDASWEHVGAHGLRDIRNAMEDMNLRCIGRYELAQEDFWDARRPGFARGVALGALSVHAVLADDMLRLANLLGAEWRAEDADDGGDA